VGDFISRKFIEIYGSIAKAFLVFDYFFGCFHSVRSVSDAECSNRRSDDRHKWFGPFMSNKISVCINGRLVITYTTNNGNTSYLPRFYGHRLCCKYRETSEIFLWVVGLSVATCEG
jgi:hypothetical protein